MERVMRAVALTYLLPVYVRAREYYVFFCLMSTCAPSPPNTHVYYLRHLVIIFGMHIPPLFSLTCVSSFCAT